MEIWLIHRPLHGINKHRQTDVKQQLVKMSRINVCRKQKVKKVHGSSTMIMKRWQFFAVKDKRDHWKIGKFILYIKSFHLGSRAKRQPSLTPYKQTIYLRTYMKWHFMPCTLCFTYRRVLGWEWTAANWTKVRTRMEIRLDFGYTTLFACEWHLPSHSK